MRKVKIFVEGSSYSELERRVNDFLRTISSEMIIDIQFQDCNNYVSVMVVYEEAHKMLTGDELPKIPTFDDIYKGEHQ